MGDKDREIDYVDDDLFDLFKRMLTNYFTSLD
jgi:hypothetical protein